MADLFSEDWMTSFQAQWNDDTELVSSLAGIDFNSVIGYGFADADQPTGVINIEAGKAVSAGAYNGETLSWDMRASAEQWQKWISKPPGMIGLGTAYASGKLKFKVGDYGAMLKDPRMAKPFIKTFGVMAKA